MNYVMSDIHGEYDKFMEMINKIELKDDDHLYILGDVLDRGPEPLQIIDYIVSKRNITLIKGNHEQMFIDHFEGNETQLWYMNGGATTHNKILNKDFLYESMLYSYIRKLPFIKVVDKFILAHAYVYIPEDYKDILINDFIALQEEEMSLWLRSNIGNEKKIKDYTVVLGHTPVQSITDSHENPQVIYRDGFMYIDCGCHFVGSDGKLACVRLDDLKEYYV